VDQAHAAAESRPALKPWAELAEGVRNANRALAGDIGWKLNRIGATVAPIIGAEERFDFSSVELEALAEHEHERWTDDRRRAGWRFGAVRDDKAKRHPSMVPWGELPEAEKHKDRAAVRNILVVLDSLGLRVVRLGPSVPAQRTLTTPVSPLG
jgi:hypothetical protein